jgi:hypothetical protein
MKTDKRNKDNAPALFHEKTKGYTSPSHLCAKQEARSTKKEGEAPYGNLLRTKNYVEKPRHYPPANKE